MTKKYSQIYIGGGYKLTQKMYIIKRQHGGCLNLTNCLRLSALTECSQHLRRQ